MLMLHTGATEVETQHLYDIPVIRPEGVSNRWKGTQHGEWRDALLRSTSDAGLEVVQERWGTNGPNEEDLFGVMEFEQNEKLPKVAELGVRYCIGTRHSNRCLFAHTIATGGKVFICDNMVITGERVISRKHTTGANIGEIAGDAVGLWLEKTADLPAMIERLQGLRLEGRHGQVAVHDFLARAAHAGLFGWGAAGRIYEEWLAPRHEEFKPRTAWSLYNATTEVAKRFAPARQIQIGNRSRMLLLGNGEGSGVPGDPYLLEVEPERESLEEQAALAEIAG